VHTRADLETEVAERPRDRARAAHSSRRTVERRQEAVPSSIYLASTEPREVCAH
jgi:hypothetical protein